MKLLFVIDKPQTFQIVGNVLLSALSRGHQCTLFSCFEPPKEIVEMCRSLGQFESRINSDKNKVIKFCANDRTRFDAVIGINFFHKGWKELYEPGMKNVYGLEYCWNEIYSSGTKLSDNRPSTTSMGNDFQSEGILFCNSNISKDLIEENLGHKKNTKCLGSPWYELIGQFKKTGDKNIITLMSPHSSLYQYDRSLQKKTDRLAKFLREYSDINGCQLVLKDREKYSRRYHESTRWDSWVFDEAPFNHLNLYSMSKVVVNFCSSSVNELSFLETPFLCVGPENQKNLHEKLNMLYYSKPFLDGIHCDSLSMKELESKEVVFQKLDQVIRSRKNWSNFKKNYFPGSHENASDRVIEYIEKSHEKSHGNTTIL